MLLASMSVRSFPLVAGLRLCGRAPLLMSAALAGLPQGFALANSSDEAALRVLVRGQYFESVATGCGQVHPAQRETYRQTLQGWQQRHQAATRDGNRALAAAAQAGRNDALDGPLRREREALDQWRRQDLGVPERSRPTLDECNRVIEGLAALPLPTGAALVQLAARAQVAPAAGFDPRAVPVSTAALQPFPYLNMPEHYVDRAKDFGLVRFPMWDGQTFRMIEGPAHMGRLSARKGYNWSRPEVQRHLEDAVRQAGGVLVASGKIPQRTIDRDLPREVLLDNNEGLGSINNGQTLVWLIRRTDRSIWIHFAGDTASGSWAIVEGPAL